MESIASRLERWGRARQEQGVSPQSDAHESVAAPCEAVTHALMHLVGDQPARHGRIRCARILAGRSVDDGVDAASDYRRYAIAHEHTVPQLVALIDSLIDGGLVDRTPGVRPTLVLTRAGHRALDALEAAR